MQQFLDLEHDTPNFFLPESELKKIDTSSNSSYFACQSHVIYILAEAKQEVLDMAEGYTVP